MLLWLQERDSVQVRCLLPADMRDTTMIVSLEGLKPPESSQIVPGSRAIMNINYLEDTIIMRVHLPIWKANLIQCTLGNACDV